MTQHDKNNYRGPEFILLQEKPPKPWELELNREKVNKPLVTHNSEKTHAISMAVKAGLTITYTSRMDA